MQVLVYGAGGVGGYMIAKLGTLLGSPGGPLHGLSVVARGAHLEEIRKSGLRFIAPDGQETRVAPTAAASDPAQLPKPDLVLLCVKGYDLESAVKALEPSIEAGTAVLPLLNGADIDSRVRRLAPKAVVFPGCMYIAAHIEQAGTVRHAGGPGLLIFGRSPDAPDSYPEQFIAACGQAGIPVEWHEDPLPAIWQKFLFIAPFSLLTAVSGKSIGGVLADPQLAADARAIADEAAALAAALNIRLGADCVEMMMQKASGFPAEMRTSFQRDIAEGKPRDERDTFGGSIVRLGAQHGIATPVSTRYLEALP